MRRTKVHLLALAFVAGVLPAAASADGWFSRMGDTKEVTLTDLLRNPREYVDVEVRFKVYFDAPGRNFNPYFTRFNEEMYGNFSAYAIDARLYDKRDYPRPYPFFFATKMDKMWKKMKDIDHLRVIQITGSVRDVFKGQPWIEVLSWSRSGGGLSEDDVKDVVNADAHYVAGRYKDAARLYERAYSSSLAAGVRADLQRRLGDACFRAGEYDDAEDAYERGLRCAPGNEVLKQGAAASAEARKRAKAARRGQAVGGEAPEIAPAEAAVVASNGTDEVIRLLEDPAKVQAEVEAWRIELEQRAAALHGGTPEATAVAGTEEPAEAAPAPEPEATEPAVEEEPVPAEGCAEAAPEGCAGEAEAVEQPEGTEPAGCAEEPTGVAEPAEGAEAGHEGCEGTAEQPEGTPEGAEAEGCAEGTTEESAAGTGEGACGGASTAGEGCAEATEQGCGEATEQGCGEGCAQDATEGCAEHGCGTAEESAPADETVAGEERVIWVSGQMVRLPRLPFFGCEDVTDDDLRAIIEEVVENPETDE